MAIFSALFWRKENKAIKELSLFLGLSFIFLGFAFGALRMEEGKNNFGHSALEAEVGKKIILEGIIKREPDVRENNTHVYLQVGEDLVLVVIGRYEGAAIGGALTVSGILKKPEAFTTEFERVFDYPGYLLAKGVEYQILSAKILENKPAEAPSFLGSLYKLKHSFTSGLETLIPEPAVGLGEGLLLGIKQALGTELETAFRKTGIIHMVVLSGYNVMLVVAFVMLLFRKIKTTWLKTVLGIGAILSFALLVGLSATVVRASLMAILLLVTQAFNRQYLVLRSLFLVGVGMLLHNPYILIFDVGFQLSFLATLGLILVMPILQKWFYFLPDKFGVRDLALATIATEIAVLPILLYQIGELSLVAVVVNTLVLPMVPVAMFLTFVTGVVYFLSFNLAWLISFPTYWSLTFINTIALKFSAIPFSSVIFPVFPFYLVIILYALLGFGLYKIYSKQKFVLGQGDLGQNFIGNKTAGENNENLNISEWFIEEEFVAVKKVGKQLGSKAKLSTPTDDTPIFFK